MSDWTFFSNYGHVLVCLARDRQARLRDVAVEVGITERAVQKIVRDLQEAGYLTVTKQGRCNRYQINKRKALRHHLQSQCTIGKLLAVLARAPERKSSRQESKAPAVDDAAAAPESPPPELPEPADSKPAGKQDEENKKASEKEKERAPVDTRQQGSLF